MICISERKKGDFVKFSRYNMLLEDEHQEYVFNTFAGSCFEVDSNVSKAIKEQDIDALDSDTRDLFLTAGILTAPDFDERRFISYVRNRQVHDASHISATIVLTWKCNLSCVYCYQDKDAPAVNMTMEDAEKCILFLTKLVEKHKSKGLDITLYGGEPLLNTTVGFHILKTLKQYCDSGDIHFSADLVTNGTLITEEILDYLSTHNCTSLQISLDGLQNMHDSRRKAKSGGGSFSQILETLKIVNDHTGIDTTIRINIDKTNLNDAHDLIKFLGVHGQGLTNCNVDFGIVREGAIASCSGYSCNCLEEGEMGEPLKALWDCAQANGFDPWTKPDRKFLFCGSAGVGTFVISPSCEIYKCWEFVGQVEHKLGDIDEAGDFIALNKYYDWMTVDPLKNDECRNCVYLPTCGGGCTVVSYMKHGSYHASGCFQIKGVIEKRVLDYIKAAPLAGPQPPAEPS